MQAAMRISRQLARPVRQVSAQAQQARAMSSASVEESIHEMNKWRRGTCSFYNVDPASEGRSKLNKVLSGRIESC